MISVFNRKRRLPYDVDRSDEAFYARFSRFLSIVQRIVYHYVVDLSTFVARWRFSPHDSKNEKETETEEYKTKNPLSFENGFLFWKRWFVVWRDSQHICVTAAEEVIAVRKSGKQKFFHAGVITIILYIQDKRGHGRNYSTILKNRALHMIGYFAEL